MRFNLTQKKLVGLDLHLCITICKLQLRMYKRTQNSYLLQHLKNYLLTTTVS